MLTQALWLVSISVVFGALSGTGSVITGLRGHSLSVFAIGLGVLADVTGSAVALVVPGRTAPARSARARRKRGRPHRRRRPGCRQRRAHGPSVTALVTGSRPGTSGITLAAAAVSLAVLAPLAYAKRRLRAGSWPAAHCAAMGCSAASERPAACWPCISLALYRALGWWWADRIAALAVAVVAAAEAWHTAPRHSSPG